MENGKELELKAIFASQKSFGGKAITRTDKGNFGNYHTLFSYETFIIELKEFDNGMKIINAITEDASHLTNVTLRHLNEFVQQHGMESHTKKEWLEIQANTVNNDY